MTEPAAVQQPPDRHDLSLVLVPPAQPPARIVEVRVVIVIRPECRIICRNHRVPPAMAYPARAGSSRESCSFNEALLSPGGITGDGGGRVLLAGNEPSPVLVTES